MNPLVLHEAKKLQQKAAFEEEYMPLRCSCCSNVFGFQHRTTGALYCVEGVPHKRPSEASPSIVKAQVPAILSKVPKLLGFPKQMTGLAGGSQ